MPMAQHVHHYPCPCNPLTPPVQQPIVHKAGSWNGLQKWHTQHASIAQMTTTGAPQANTDANASSDVCTSSHVSEFECVG